MKPPILIPPIPALAELREAVLERSEKRKPKWGFRIAGDLVLELQAQPVSLVSPAAIARGLRQADLGFEGQAERLRLAKSAPAEAAGAEVSHARNLNPQPFRVPVYDPDHVDLHGPDSIGQVLGETWRGIN